MRVLEHPPAHGGLALLGTGRCCACVMKEKSLFQLSQGNS